MYRYVDTSGLWGSLAFVSNLEMLGNAPICRKLFPVWRGCTLMSCLRKSMSINILKRWGEENFEWRVIERMKKNSTIDARICTLKCCNVVSWFDDHSELCTSCSVSVY